jgi:hypothetical protein
MFHIQGDVSLLVFLLHVLADFDLLIAHNWSTIPSDRNTCIMHVVGTQQ